MKINLTKKQYKDLLQTTYVVRWMTEAYQIDSGDRFLETEQALLAMAGDFGLQEYVDFDDEMDLYLLSETFLAETEIAKLIADYNQVLFWDELSIRLGIRDFKRQRGPDQELSPAELAEASESIQEHYMQEFEANGLENLILDPALR